MKTGQQLREERDFFANADIPRETGTLEGMTNTNDDITLVDKSMFHKDLVVADAYTIRQRQDGKRSEKKQVVKLGGRRKRHASVAGCSILTRLYTGLEMPTDEVPEFQAVNDGK